MKLDGEEVSWGQELRKAYVYQSSLPMVRARLSAAQKALALHSSAPLLVPYHSASCSPLFFRLQVGDEGAAEQLLGPRSAYNPVPSNLPEATAASLLRSVAAAVLSLHQVGIVHGHLRRDVVLHRSSPLESPTETHVSPAVLLADYPIPFSFIVPQSPYGQAMREVAAPEILRGEPFTTSADVWGLGVLLLQLVHGQAVPLTTDDLVDTNLLSPHIVSLSPMAKSFVLPCVKADANARPLLVELLQHPFLTCPCTDDVNGTDDSSDGEEEDEEEVDADEDEEEEDEEDDSSDEVEA